MGEDLPRLDQERAARRGQLHMMSCALQQRLTKFPLLPLQLLTQRGLNDVLTVRRPTEMQLLSKSHEITQLTKLNARHPGRPCPILNSGWERHSHRTGHCSIPVSATWRVLVRGHLKTSFVPIGAPSRCRLRAWRSSGDF